MSKRVSAAKPSCGAAAEYLSAGTYNTCQHASDMDDDRLEDACDSCPRMADTGPSSNADEDGVPVGDNCTLRSYPLQANCNFDAERAAGVDPKGDGRSELCDPTPCAETQLETTSQTGGGASCAATWGPSRCRRSLALVKVGAAGRSGAGARACGDRRPRGRCVVGARPRARGAFQPGGTRPASRKPPAESVRLLRVEPLGQNVRVVGTWRRRSPNERYAHAVGPAGALYVAASPERTGRHVVVRFERAAAEDAVSPTGCRVGRGVLVPDTARRADRGGASLAVRPPRRAAPVGHRRGSRHLGGLHRAARVHRRVHVRGSLVNHVTAGTR